MSEHVAGRMGHVIDYSRLTMAHGLPKLGRIDS